MTIITTREQLDLALDKGPRPQILTPSGKWYDLRRNGRTRVPKGKPDMWLCPCKCGFRGYVLIDQSDLDRNRIRVRPENFDERTRR